MYRRLQAEIDDYYVANGLKSGITYHQTQSLPYLVAVCKEAMRLLPSIVFQLLRHVPAEGMYVGKDYIPGGSEVGISPMAQNRDQDIWGPDADDFRPERWLESEERTRFLDSYNMTFGGNGPRMCVGKNIALVSSSFSTYLSLELVGSLIASRWKYTNSSHSFSIISTFRFQTLTNPGISRLIGLPINTISTAISQPGTSFHFW